jgi:hypothetical protein
MSGFDQNVAKHAVGLRRPCVNFVIRGTRKGPGAKKPLLTVDPELVAAYKTKNP